MNMYYGILIWFVLVFFLFKDAGKTQEEYIAGKKYYRYHWSIAFLIFLPMILWAGYRTEWFGDTHMYKMVYKAMPSSISMISQYIEEKPKDPGFSVLSIFLKSFLGDNVEFYFLVLAFIQGICLVRMFQKYSSNYIMAIFIFVTCSDYFSFMHNGIRQFMAVTISMLAFGYLLEKKYVHYVLIILLASTMHQSALLLIPIAFIVQGKAWNSRTILMLVAALVAVAFIGQFTNILDNMLSDTQYTNVVSDWKEWEDDGTNPLRVLVYAVPSILAFIGIKHIKQTDNPVINIATNMSLVTLGIYIISMFTSGIFIGRLPIYTSTYSMGILLPWEIENIFDERSAQLVKYCMIIGFLGFYYYQMHFAWGVM